ncbi:MAG: hypothetical protein MJ082_05400 [Clostridia bacterium]|nr:hypothetical protein [Clostridia bacterium]
MKKNQRRLPEKPPLLRKKSFAYGFKREIVNEEIRVHSHQRCNPNRVIAFEDNDLIELVRLRTDAGNVGFSLLSASMITKAQ